MPRSMIPDALRVRASDVQRSIGRLAAAGTTRLAYTDEDNAGRAVAIEMMREVDLAVRIDAAGNIFGRRAGTSNLPSIMSGSHIDTVREAGRFDGVLGVVAAIECIRVLQGSRLETRHPLEVVIFTNEEGQHFSALTGSRAAVGEVNANELEHAGTIGKTLAEAIRYIGGRPEKLADSIIRKGTIAIFLELHIEQGGELDELGTPIGIVEGISGIQHTDVRITGMANHSGTTGMAARQDALVAAAELVLAVQRMAAELHLCRVATVGRLTVSPNSTNIVPGAAELTVEVRDMQTLRISGALAHLRQEAELIAQRWRVSIEFLDRKLVHPVPADPAVQDAIEQSCTELELPFTRIPSGAGHDAQMMARVARMGMIFVPSVGGISHSTQEFTRAEDCASGADVLLHTILRLDRQSAGRDAGVWTQ